MPDFEQQVKDLFAQADELAPSEWAAFLEERCDNPEVRRRVEQLLAHRDKAGEFLERSAVEMFPQFSGAIGPQLAEFRIVREIGRGGMGIVYLAEDTVLRRAVALKVLSPGGSTEERQAQRFRKEAQAAARLSHPGIVQIYRTGQERGFSYIAMEYVAGQTLRAELSVGHERSSTRLEGAQPEADEARQERGSALQGSCTDSARIRAIARLISEVADALDHAHRQGVIHRDVKPSNILVDRAERARLTDFGIARIVSEKTLSAENNIAGSISYMSPEQARVQRVEIDHRSDIFSLGVVLYESLTGVRPFDGATPQDVFRALTEGQPRNIRQLNAAVPRDLATICHKAIEKLQHDRYQTAAHMGADLRCYLSGQPILAVPPTVQRRLRQWLLRNRTVAVGVGAAALLTTIALLLALISQQRDRTRAWLRIDPGALPMSVVIQPVNPVTLHHDAPAEQKEIRTEWEIGLPPGNYRVTLIASSATNETEFGEVDALLIDLGRENATVVRAIREAEPFPGGSAHLLVRLLPMSRTPQPGMSRIAAGAYECGLREQSYALMRNRVVSLRAFDLDQIEVPNAEYLKFLYETAGDSAIRQRLDAIVAGVDLDPPAGTSGLRHHHPHTPEYWKSRGYDATLADRPVVGVRRRDAQAFAAWRGKRLPTIMEWDAAACYPSGNANGPRIDYPSGRSADGFPELVPDAAYVLLDQSRDTRIRLQIYEELSQPVTASDPLATESGLKWLFGNVTEITGSIDVGRPGGVSKGRSWLDDPRSSPLAQVWTFPLDEYYYNRGFRCARSAAPIGKH